MGPISGEQPAAEQEQEKEEERRKADNAKKRRRTRSQHPSLTGEISICITISTLAFPPEPEWYQYLSVRT